MTRFGGPGNDHHDSLVSTVLTQEFVPSSVLALSYATEAVAATFGSHRSDLFSLIPR